MEQKLYEAALTGYLSKEFVDEFVKLCKKHNTNANFIINKIYWVMEL